MYEIYLNILKEFNKSKLPEKSSDIIKWYKDYCGFFYLFMYGKGAKLIEERGQFLLIRKFRNIMEHSWPEGKKDLNFVGKIKSKINFNQHLIAEELKELCEKIEKQEQKNWGIESYLLMDLYSREDWEDIKFDYIEMPELIWGGLERFYGFPIKTDADYEKALELIPPSVVAQYPTIKAAVIMHYVNCKY